MIDFVLMKMLKYRMGVKSKSWLGLGMSDHYVNLFKIKLVIGEKETRKKLRRIKSENLCE